MFNFRSIEKYGTRKHTAPQGFSVSLLKSITFGFEQFDKETGESLGLVMIKFTVAERFKNSRCLQTFSRPILSAVIKKLKITQLVEISLWVYRPC